MSAEGQQAQPDVFSLNTNLHIKKKVLSWKEWLSPAWETEYVKEKACDLPYHISRRQPLDTQSMW